MMKLEQGRPADVTGRLEKEVRVYDLLDQLEIPYRRIDHEAANTMEACREVDEVLGVTICRNIFLCNRQQTDFYLLLIEDGKVFKTKYLSAQLGTSRLSFAPPEFMEEFLDIKPGAVSVLGLMNDKDCRVKLVMDKSIYESDETGCHPCVTASLQAAITCSRRAIILLITSSNAHSNVSCETCGDVHFCCPLYL